MRKQRRRKSSSKARLEEEFFRALIYSEVFPKTVSLICTVSAFAIICATLWMIDPWLVRTFTGQIQIVLPVCLNYLMRP